MIESIELENYRGFEHYKLSNLARVNLLVGKNNSGKSSILEAAYLFASGGDLQILSKIARHRGELIFYGDDLSPKRKDYADFSHFFNGHIFGAGSYFEIRTGNGSGSLKYHVEAVNADGVDPNIRQMFTKRGARGSNIFFREGINTPIYKHMSGVSPLTEEGANLDDHMIIQSHIPGKTPREIFPVQFVSPDSLQKALMSEMWDYVLAENRENDVVTAMKTLEPTLNSIVFLSGERSYRHEARSGILVGFEGNQKRVPLGSYGEGMRRMLALALALANTKNGMLLIDEVDTGLHYSIMGDMWKLIVETARANDTQVFLTTHSLDCVRGLAWLCENYPELGKEVSLQKIEPNLKESVSLNADEIRIAIDQDLEVR